MINKFCPHESVDHHGEHRHRNRKINQFCLGPISQYWEIWYRCIAGHHPVWAGSRSWVRRRRVTARFVTRFNLWLRHDLWPHNASICDPARFVTKSASICDQRYTMILESKLCRGKLVFVFTLIMYTKWYNMIIYIYELWYNAYMNSGARSLMLFALILF